MGRAVGSRQQVAGKRTCDVGNFHHQIMITFFKLLEIRRVNFSNKRAKLLAINPNTADFRDAEVRKWDNRCCHCHIAYSSMNKPNMYIVHGSSNYTIKCRFHQYFSVRFVPFASILFIWFDFSFALMSILFKSKNKLNPAFGGAFI